MEYARVLTSVTLPKHQVKQATTGQHVRIALEDIRQCLRGVMTPGWNAELYQDWEVSEWRIGLTLRVLTRAAQWVCLVLSVYRMLFLRISFARSSRALIALG